MAQPRSIRFLSTPLLVAALAATSSTCSHDAQRLSGPGDYIVFGDFYGECFGDGCVDIFRISDGRLYADTLDIYPVASKLPHTVEFVQLPGARYSDVASLIGDVPARLFDEAAVVIGQPDAGDWGGFYLETNVSGEIRYWLIDKMDDNLPGYLRDFTRKLDEAIQIAAE
ncbi:MAG TPA: hypothetical protein VMO47_08105 [Rhodothermales bacterium]|nr:hypothetical protein [Rhodothermales bacterium]